MKTLKGLNDEILGLDGKPLTENGRPLAIKKLLANVLARGQDDDPVRAMVIAMSIHGADGTVELEDADFGLLELALKKDQFLNNMAKAAALTVLNGSAS